MKRRERKKHWEKGALTTTKDQIQQKMYSEKRFKEYLKKHHKKCYTSRDSVPFDAKNTNKNEKWKKKKKYAPCERIES